jgi:hypothetical protein
MEFHTLGRALVPPLSPPPPRMLTMLIFMCAKSYTPYYIFANRYRINVHRIFVFLAIYLRKMLRSFHDQ